MGNLPNRGIVGFGGGFDGKHGLIFFAKKQQKVLIFYKKVKPLNKKGGLLARISPLKCVSCVPPPRLVGDK